MTIGERIKGLREARGWSKWDLALKAGIQQQNVYLWESGECETSARFFPALATAFGMTVPQFLDGVELDAEKEV